MAPAPLQELAAVDASVAVLVVRSKTCWSISGWVIAVITPLRVLGLRMLAVTHEQQRRSFLWLKTLHEDVAAWYSFCQEKSKQARTMDAPPAGLLAFYWHFVRQTKGWYAAMFAASLALVALDTVIRSSSGSSSR